MPSGNRSSSPKATRQRSGRHSRDGHAENRTPTDVVLYRTEGIEVRRTVDDSATVYPESSTSHSPRYRTARPSNDQYSLSRVPEIGGSREGSQDTLSEYRQERSASGRAWEEEQARSERRRRVNEGERLERSDRSSRHHGSREADQPRSLRPDMFDHDHRSHAVAATLHVGNDHGREQLMYGHFHDHRSGREQHISPYALQATSLSGHEYGWTFDPHQSPTHGQYQQPLHYAPRQPVANAHHDPASSRTVYQQHPSDFAAAPSQSTIIASQYLQYLHETYALPELPPTTHSNLFDPQHPMWNGRFDHVQPAHSDESISGYLTRPVGHQSPMYGVIPLSAQAHAHAPLSARLDRPSSSLPQAPHSRMIYPMQEIRSPQYREHAARRQGVEMCCWNPRDVRWYAYEIEDDWNDPR